MVLGERSPFRRHLIRTNVANYMGLNDATRIGVESGSTMCAHDGDFTATVVVYTDSPSVLDDNHSHSTRLFEFIKLGSGLARRINVCELLRQSRL
jgi:hypothetical protein